MDYPVERCSVSFDIPLTDFTEVVEKDVVKKTIHIAWEAARELNARAPIDTSRYVSNMNLAYGAPDWSHDDDRYLGRTGALGRAAYSLGTIPSAEINNIYLSNTIDYADDLEAGSSRQAIDGIFDPSLVALKHRFYNQG